MVSEADFLAWVRNMDGVVMEKMKYKEDEALAWKRGERIFAVVYEGTSPLRVELRCDGRLAGILKERYESVMAGRVLGRNGVEVVCSGQLSREELRDLLRHAYAIAEEK